MPMIGLIRPEQENIFVLTGFSKWGLANAAIGSKVLGGLLNNQETPYSKLFDPSRDIPDIKEENKEEANSKYNSSIHRRKIETLERSEEHTSELQSRGHLVCRLLLEKKNTKKI